MQHVLEQEYIRQYGKILILQCEDGEAKLRASAIRNKNVLLDPIDRKEKICYELFLKIKLELNPDLVLIEYNGTWPIETLLAVPMPKNCKMDRIVFCADASAFDFYMKNTGGLMAGQLGNADAVLFNRVAGEMEPLKNTVRSLNRSAWIALDEDTADAFLKKLFGPKASPENRRLSRRRGLIALILLIGVCILSAELLPVSRLYALLQSVNMVFIGILMQAVPFLLIGAFVSALLQIFVPDETLVRLFTANKWLGFPLAVILGFFFPVCDCGVVPIASRLAQKGVPLPEAMVFMLAAPAVSPVTILSTLYAFPGQPQYALYRIAFGVLISLIAGSALGRSHRQAALVRSGGTAAVCSCGSGGCTPRHSGKPGKAEAVLMTAGQEFLGMGRYIIVGSLACAILQQTVPASWFQHTDTAIIPVIIMLLAAFFMSVCSTSNAFLGRSFLNVFPPAAVLAFLVMGPMLDLSNLFLLSANFKKKFVVRLAGILFLSGLGVFLPCSLLLKGRVL